MPDRAKDGVVLWESCDRIRASRLTPQVAQVALTALALLLGPAVLLAADPDPRGVFDVRRYGAAGDGTAIDTKAINEAIDACAQAGGGQVLLPPGSYLSGTVVLRSHVTLKLDAGARLVGTPDLEAYRHYAAPEGTPEARSPKWHRALVLGVDVEDVRIVGPGTIDGNKVFDPRGEERMRGPHTIILGGSRDITIRDLDVTDSANYAILVEFSSQVEVRGVKVSGGWDGVHFRGWIDRPCRDIRIVGCQFYTGDDGIAGRYAERLLVSDCVINSSCNGIRIIGPVESAIVHDCLLYGPGLHPHRTQDRHNMLAGIIIQPGAWDVSDGAVDGVLISDVTMKDVTTPLAIYLRRPGNTATGITVNGLKATGVYRAPASVESWTETPVGRVVLRDVDIEYEGGGTAEDGTKAAAAPGVDARALPVWGIYARKVRDLVLEDVRLGCEAPDLRPVLIAEDVGKLTLDAFRFPRTPGVAEPLIFRNVASVERADGAAQPAAAPGAPAGSTPAP